MCFLWKMNPFRPQASLTAMEMTKEIKARGWQPEEVSTSKRNKMWCVWERLRVADCKVILSGRSLRGNRYKVTIMQDVRFLERQNLTLHTPSFIMLIIGLWRDSSSSESWCPHLSAASDSWLNSFYPLNHSLSQCQLDSQQGPATKWLP